MRDDNDDGWYSTGYADGQSHAREAVALLVAKAKALVDLMDDAERNHGSLVGAKTLRGVNELRLELSKWR